MQIRKLREDIGLSQERLAEATGLSLRTVQRAEAGHRVSYASLRALATTFEIDVDLLERELYAMSTAKDDYVEKPLWVRLLLSLPSIRSLGHSDLIRHEVILVAYALFAFAASFAVPRVEFSFGHVTTTDALHFSAFSALLCAYIVSVTLRLRHQFSGQTPTSA
ncbi:helix-turn-helix transcriptional regulator [Gilvimarinus sp. SDUM040013]|uniref:Helix-turn-helix transcriptional regulator n=1 Tax=Gilvimarinus gilvus TaxID=3058038 RepID=A0ABU4S4Y8_9GAMM|nr:helix-turn-helix transcriptional regulator [Gilvimarinus sp. SDUM040013]MDO3385368.1 helix-turn-helix transcriptional regulator [Gilvimarinus sp. SDUM040013]MDX6850943.1 helix-turn-helix transcriptional regulator [Gilvimarinus sp. SDUM040013]